MTDDEIADRLDRIEQRLGDLERSALQGGIWVSASGKEFTLADAIGWLEHLSMALTDAHARLDDAGIA